MNKLEIWTPEEAGLLYEMKSRCLNGGNYKDEKAKEKFKMLCHLEDYCIEFYEGEKEIERLNNELINLQNRFNNLMEAHKICDEDNERLNNIIDKLEKYFNNSFKNEISVWELCLDKLKELKEGK